MTAHTDDPVDKAGDSTPRLEARHVEYLAKRAVSEELALRAGLRTVTGAEGGRLLGYDYAIRSCALAIPYFDAGGRTVSWRLRLDEGRSRFLCPSGACRPSALAGNVPGSARQEWTIPWPG